MTFFEAIASVFGKYVTFSGRAARSEYWYYALFLFVVGVITMVLDTAMFDLDWSPLNTAFSLATFLPSLAVSVRRLHDIDRTGWWVLIALTIVGIILLLVWACTRGTAGPNRFGPDPLGNAPA